MMNRGAPMFVYSPRGEVTAAPTVIPASKSMYRLPISISKNEQIMYMVVDWDALHYIGTELSKQMTEKFVPFKTLGDGNCLLHAVSRAIWGSEVYHELLRKLLKSELVDFREFYQAVTKVETDEGEEEKSDYNEILKQAEKGGSHLSFVHCLALANVIKRPMVVYAGDEDVERFGEGQDGVCALFLPTRIGASAAHRVRPIAISWSSKLKNHFVPIVPLEAATFTWKLPKLAFSDTLQEGETLEDYIHYETEEEERKNWEELVQQQVDAERKRVREEFKAAMKLHYEKRKAESRKPQRGKKTYLIRGTNFVIIDGDDEPDAEDSNMFDLVFSIKFGSKKGQIGWNKDDDPYDTAVRFCEKHGLQQYSTKIHQFLMDCLYQKWQEGWMPGAQKEELISEHFGQELPPEPAIVCKNIPYRGPPLSYSKGKIPAIRKKLLEFNEQLLDQPSTQNVALGAGELQTLYSVLTILSNDDGKDKSFSHAQLDILLRLLRWPASKVWPVIDVARLMILNPCARDYYLSGKASVSLFQAMLSLGSDLKASGACKMLTLKFIANMFSDPNLLQMILLHKQKVIDIIAAVADEKIVKKVLPDVLLNFAYTFKDQHSPRVKTKLISLLAKSMSDSALSSVHRFRCLVVFGTVVWRDRGMRKEAKRSMSVEKLLHPFITSADRTVASTAKEIFMVLNDDS